MTAERWKHNELSPAQATEILRDWKEPLDFELMPLAGDGSDRIYYRLLYSDRSRVLLWNPQPLPGVNGLNDNDSFAVIGKLLAAVGGFAPAIYQQDLAQGVFLLEDLGDEQLYHIVRRSAADPELAEAYREVLGDLAQMVERITRKLDAGKIHNPDYDAGFMREWESGYFQQRLLPLYPQVEYETAALDRELDQLAQRAAVSSDRVFLYRDFQSKNIMRHAGRWRYIDFQGGRLGPATYDPASLLIDPYVDLAPDLQEELVEYYRELRGEGDRFRENYELVALHRNLQALGAYGYLSRVKGKPGFIRYIPAAVHALQRRLRHPLFTAYPVLKSVADQLTEQVVS